MIRQHGIYSIKDVTTDSGAFDEPVTTQELKDYLRLEGFTDTNESTSDSLSDFDYDDDLIDEIITAARESMEQYSGIILVPKTIEVVFSNEKGRIELPGPVGEISEALDDCGNGITLTDLKLVGNVWKYVKWPCYRDMVWTYAAGYGTDDLPALPKAIKLDIMRLAAYLYIHRGDDPAIQVYASQLAKKYKRNPWQ